MICWVVLQCNIIHSSALVHHYTVKFHVLYFSVILCNAYLQHHAVEWGPAGSKGSVREERLNTDVDVLECNVKYCKVM